MLREVICGIFLIDANGYVLLLRPRSNDAEQFSIPKGINNRNESYLTTAYRKFKENTGFDIEAYDHTITYTPERISYGDGVRYLKAFFITIDIDLNNIDFKCGAKLDHLPENNRCVLMEMIEVYYRTHKTQSMAINKYWGQ